MVEDRRLDNPVATRDWSLGAAKCQKNAGQKSKKEVAALEAKLAALKGES